MLNILGHKGYANQNDWDFISLHGKQKQMLLWMGTREVIPVHFGGSVNY
jgi:hypothetical protein